MDKSGREFPVELSIVPLPSGGETLFVGFLRDITERRQAEERLALSEESLRLTTEAAEIGIWTRPRKQTCSPGPPEQGHVRHFADVPCSMDDFYAGLHPDDRDAIAEALRERWTQMCARPTTCNIAPW